MLFLAAVADFVLLTKDQNLLIYTIKIVHEWISRKQKPDLPLRRIICGFVYHKRQQWWRIRVQSPKPTLPQEI